MKFLICGLGSIGQRHVRVLRQITGDETEIGVFRQRGLPIVINDDMTARTDTSPEEHYGLKSYNSLDHALDRDLTAVFVTNPISMHVPVALRAAEAGHNIFLEKPLAASTDGLDRLTDLVSEKRLVTMVGYQLRFHPALRVIHGLLQDRKIGNIVSADIHFGEWLPGMHPYEDYRESHAARSDQGGGVVNCLSHEIDYALWLFGKPRSVTAIGGHFSDLEMDVEDTCDMLLNVYGNAQDTIPVHIHLDFLARVPRRYCYILGDQGTIFWDYYENVVELRLEGSSEPVRTGFPDFQRNEMFISETENFLAAISRAQPSDIPLSEGIRTLETCIAARQAMQTGQAVML